MIVSEKTELTSGECNGATGDSEDQRCKRIRTDKDEGRVKSIRRRLLKRKSLQKLKSAAGHVGLLLTLMLYTAVGGVVSYHTNYEVFLIVNQ